MNKKNLLDELLDMKLFKPFGPSIAKVTIPEAIINELNKYTDEIVKDSDKLNQAEILYKKSISVSETKKEKAISYGNLGNSQLLNQKIEKSIDSYKNSLRLVPENQ